MGVIVQFVLLVGLTVGVGLGAVGWLAGAVCAVVTYVVIARAMQVAGMRTLGPANQVTLARAALVAGVAALVADSLTGHHEPVSVLVGISSVALVLDAVDGQVARRTDTVSAMGARFDMEVDAFLILVLSVFVARSLGIWVLTIGLLRYAFVAASRFMPWMKASLPPRLSRKTVAAVQGIVLVVAVSGILTSTLAAAVVGSSLLLLCWSFGRDITWLWHSATVVSAAGGRYRPTTGVEAVRRQISSM